MYKKIAEEIRGIEEKEVCLYIHETLLYGNYPSYLRTKGAYNQGQANEKIVMLVPFYRVKEIRKMIEVNKVQYFYYFKPGYNEPLALVTFSKRLIVNPNEFNSALQVIKELTINMRNLDYEIVVKQAARYFDEAVKNQRGPIVRIIDAAIISKVAYSLIMLGKPERIIDFYKNGRIKDIYMPDEHYALALSYASIQNMKMAKMHLTIAAKKAPGWKKVINALKSME